MPVALLPAPPIAGGSANVIVWSATRTWAQVYADIISAGGTAIVLVPNDSQKEMTPDPSGPTDLSNVLFVGIVDQANTCPIIDIDSLGVGGFSLGGNLSLHSKDISWQTYYRILAAPSTFEFDGGGLSSATVEDCCMSDSFTFVLRNGAKLNGTNCTFGLFRRLRAGAVVYTTGGCEIQDKSFYANIGVPPFPNVQVYTDASVTISPTAIAGNGGLGLLIIPYDKAEYVKYDDSLVLPLTGQTQVQNMLDYLKESTSPPGHFRIDLWSAGETWQEIYDRFILNANGGLLYVNHDGATPRVMTPNPLGDTDLNNVWFIGVRQANGALPTIQIDPGNIGGFKLTGQADLHSKDLHWEMPGYEIGDSIFYGESFIELDGTDIKINPLLAPNQGVWKAATVRLSMKNSSLLDGTGCDVGKAIIELTGLGPDTSNVKIETLSKLGVKSLASAVAHPLLLSQDASALIDALAITSPPIAISDVDTWYGNLRISGPTGPKISSGGFADPNTNVFGSPGDLYLSPNGGANITLWVKESGSNTNTGWVGK